MICLMLRVTFLLFCFVANGLGANQSSTLRVAACNPGLVPFVSISEGKLVGYDIDIWGQVWDAMVLRVQNADNDPAVNGTITPEILELIGDAPPTILNMTTQQIQTGLQAGTIDVGMCGYFVTQPRMQQFDFTSPFYLMSGLQSVIKAGDNPPTVLFLITALVGTVDYTAQLIMLILIIGVVIFGHLIAGAENLKLSSKEEYRSNYFEGTQDGMWFSIVVMSTVGFGDIAPRTTGGRFLTIIWIFLSIALMAMFMGIVTSNFGKLVLVQGKPQQSIVTTNDLVPYRVGVASSYALSVIQRNPNITIVSFPIGAQDLLFQALNNGSIDVAVDRPDIIRYYNTLHPTYEGTMRTVGNIFAPLAVSFGVRRPGPNIPHPLLRLLSLAVADATRGPTGWQRAASTFSQWFGSGDAGVSDVLAAEQADLNEKAEADIRTQTATALIIVFCAWIGIGAVLAVARFPAYQSGFHISDAVRRSAGMPPPDTPITLGIKNQAIARLKTLLYKLADPVEFDKAVAEATAEDGEGDKPPKQGGSGGPGAVAAAAGKKSPPAPPAAAKVEASVVAAGARFGTAGGGKVVAPGVEKEQGAAVVAAAVTEDHLEPKIRVSTYIRYVAKVLAITHRRVKCYHWLTRTNYTRAGEAMMWAAFRRSYKAVEALLDDWHQFNEGMEMTTDGLCEVLMDMACKSMPGWLEEGGLFFPHRNVDDEAHATARSFEHVSRLVQRLGARVAAGQRRIESLQFQLSPAAAIEHRYAAAAAAVAAVGIPTSPALGGDAGGDGGWESLPSPEQDDMEPAYLNGTGLSPHGMNGSAPGSTARGGMFPGMIAAAGGSGPQSPREVWYGMV